MFIVIGPQCPECPKINKMYNNAGGGNPNDRALQRMGVTPIPRGDVARKQYIDQGGSITQFGTFGVDPLPNSHQTGCTL